MKPTGGRKDQYYYYMENLDLAYFAGFFDGEGSVGISKYYAQMQEHIRMRIVVQISQVHPVPLYRIQDEFGGYIRHYQPVDGNKHIYHLSFTGTKAYIFLKKLLPFLIVKREESLLAIEFYERFHRKEGFFDEKINFYNVMKSMKKVEFPRC